LAAGRFAPVTGLPKALKATATADGGVFVRFRLVGEENPFLTWSDSDKYSMKICDLRQF
jgi:hypothetical protein